MKAKETNTVFQNAIRAAGEADKAIAKNTRLFRRTGLQLIAKIQRARMPKDEKTALVKTMRKAMKDV